MAGCTAIVTQKDVPRYAINLDPHCCPGRRGPASAGPKVLLPLEGRKVERYQGVTPG